MPSSSYSTITKGSDPVTTTCRILRITVLALATTLAFLPLLPSTLAGKLVLVSLCSLPIIFVSILLSAFGPKRWKMAHIVTLLFCIPIFRGYIPILPRPAEGNSKTIKVVSWNVDNFLVNRDTMQQAARHINHLSPDIICFQERPHETLVSWNGIRKAFPSQSYAVRNSREDEVLNLAILSSYPIIGSGERQFEGTYNRYLWADIRVSDDTIRVFNAHLQTTGLTSSFGWSDVSTIISNAEERNRQADLLYTDVKDSPHPVVLCGDFNDTPSGYTARRIRNELTDLSCLWPFCGSYKALGGLLKIDYMMCDKHMRPIRYQLFDTPWSDHRMQFGEMELN